MLEKLTFYIIILFLPTQLGKHFWPDFSYVLGVQVDYLSPTVYFTDVLIFLLFLVWAAKKFFPRSWIPLRWANFNFPASLGKFQIILALVFLTIGIMFSKNPQAGLYGLVKLLEFSFFGYYVASFFSSPKAKTELHRVIFLFIAGIVFESVLSVSQFFKQGSINGMLYFLGERYFTGQTVGIANASLNGVLVMRPYGTLSHPNVLAGYLIIAMTIVFSVFQFSFSNAKKVIYSVAFVLGTIALFLTMSRVAVVLWLLFVGCWIMLKAYQRDKFQLSTIVLILLVSVLFFSPLRFRFSNISFSDESIIIRKDLALVSLQMIRDNFAFGVGLKNFIVKLPEYKHASLMGNNRALWLQPAHNIFLLIASETGIVGLMFFLWFLIKTYKRIMNYELGIKNKGLIIHNSLFLILSTILILGLFDHYWLTLQQGQLLFAFVFGLSWGQIKRRDDIIIRKSK